MVAEFMHEASADASTLPVDAGKDKPAATFGDVFHACLSLYHAPADFERDVQLFHRLPEREQIRVALNHDVFKHVKLRPWRMEKDDERSEQLRLEGNLWFRARRFKKALARYNESLMFASDTPRSNGKCCRSACVYFNRGVVLYKLKRHEECIFDMEIAFMLGYTKLNEKEGQAILFKSYIKTGRLSEAQQIVVDCADLRAKAKFEAYADKKFTLLRTRLIEYQHVSPVCAAHLNSAGSLEQYCRTRFDLESEEGRRQYRRLLVEAGKGDSDDGEREIHGGGDASLCLELDHVATCRDKARTHWELKPGGDHPNFTRLSSAVEIDYNQELGRHFKAARDIRPGEVLVDEPPYCISLMPDQWKKRCLNCCRRTDLPVPCTSCAMVVFCSDMCRESSWNNGHEAECQMMGNIRDEARSQIESLATRIVFKAGLKTLLRHRYKLEELTEEEAKTGFLSLPVTGTDYLDICTLLTRKEIWHPQLTFQAAMFVAFNIRLMQMTRFFEPEMVFTEKHEMAVAGAGSSSSSSGGSSQQQSTSSSSFDLVSFDRMIYVGRMMFRHVLALRSNRFGIDETAYTVGDVNNRPKMIARAVTATGMVLNHACLFNCVYTMNPSNGRIVFKAIVPIKKGEEITHCYTCNYATKTAEERRFLLCDQYGFICKCRACVENWPTLMEAVEQQMVAVLVCPKCRSEVAMNDWTATSSETVKCQNCNYNLTHDIADLRTMWLGYQDAVKLLSTRRSYNGAQAVQAYMAKAHQLLHPRSAEYMIVAENLKKIYMRQGHCKAVTPGVTNSEADDSGNELGGH